MDLNMHVYKMHTQTDTTYIWSWTQHDFMQVIAPTYKHSHCRLSVCKLKNDGALQ